MKQRQLYNFTQLAQVVGQERTLKDWKTRGWLQPSAVSAGGRKYYDLDAVEDAKRTSLIEAEKTCKTRSIATTSASDKARRDKILETYLPTKKG